MTWTRPTGRAYSRQVARLPDRNRLADRLVGDGGRRKVGSLDRGHLADRLVRDGGRHEIGLPDRDRLADRLVGDGGRHEVE